jgi:hypothetical protein
MLWVSYFFSLYSITYKLFFVSKIRVIDSIKAVSRLWITLVPAFVLFVSTVYPQLVRQDAQ